MSWPVNSALIPLDERERLRRSLYLVSPKKDNAILCLSHRSGEGNIHPEEAVWLLPFAFGKHRFPKFREEKDFPHISFEFTGKAKPNQIKPLEEAWSILSTSGSVILNFPTGYGKTASAILLSSLTQKIVCVVSPISTLEKQWKDSFAKFGNASVWIVGEKIPEVVSVVITSPGRIHKIPQVLRESIGCLIVDEVHLFCTQLRYDKLLEIEPEYCIALSATLEKEKHHRDALSLMFGRVIEVESKVKFTIHRYLTGIHIPSVKKYDKKRGKMVEDWTTLCHNMASNKERNQKILDLICSNTQKILVLTSLVEHARNLHKELLERGEDASLLQGKDKDYKDARILVSNYKKAGTGFDDSMFCSNFSGKLFDVVYVLFSMKGIILLKQVIGRVRNENPEVVEFLDEHDILKNHARQRDKYYKSKKYDVYLRNLHD
nr:A18-like helicase [Cedratvirus plubellavi]